jgi:hypothetical protein
MREEIQEQACIQNNPFMTYLLPLAAKRFC